MMLRARRITLAAIVGLMLATAACEQPPPPKPLGERILDKMVESCKAMAPKEEQAQCVLSPGLRTLEATNAMHRILVKLGMTMFPRDAGTATATVPS
jgi:hypothetical protein